MAAPKSAFPHFVDGDVLIVISTTQHYKLHSQVLSAHSTYFADHFASRPGPRLNAQARRENLPAYHFEFKRAPDGEFGEFVRADINESGHMVTAANIPLMPDLDNGNTPDNTNRAWDWLFGVFYNREPIFDDTSLATVLSCVVALIECGEAINSIEHVRDVVDLALMRQDNVLWTSILGNPHVWIELGRRVRSPAIYGEAVIHLVGQWGTIPEGEKSRMSEDIRKIITRKANELSVMKEAIELRILGHYPEFMRRSAADKPGRPTYGNDIYMWMAVCFFRQWFAQSISDDRTRRAPDGGLSFYTALSEGGDAYISHVDFQEFHKYFPMSMKACQLLEANMGVLKEDVKRFVDELMVERTHLKRDEHMDIAWLTCVNVEKEDLPWHDLKIQKKSTSNLAKYDNMYDEAATDENAMAQALAEASAAQHPPYPKAEHGSSSRGKKRPRVSDQSSAGDSTFYQESIGTNAMFVSEDGDMMEE
ncbi:hypothetical protein G647_05171 [Cladophialophora carrionii CBS 160.54]|uniref:BTB domain-containing protein n=1 Tax=Cladophialophora carrionii CBS 160.54 TaxID=1279043 RepID=V9D971_9EURO|nr:uncharacterized protein G647_05171 [Cladophialophora carrionii CBS 160.54]ETI23370.1 hypothetical protein G647_05171 [Cladophialophora carrionii CBS 160.54]